MIIDFPRGMCCRRREHAGLLPGPDFTATFAPPGAAKVPTTIENRARGRQDRRGGISPSSPIRCTICRDMDRQQQLERLPAAKIASMPPRAGQASLDPRDGPRRFPLWGRRVPCASSKRAIKAGRAQGAAWITLEPQGEAIRTTTMPCPSFQLACELDVPVVIHPPSVGFGEERMKDYRPGLPPSGVRWTTRLALARLIVRGNIREISRPSRWSATHLGGGICEMIGRMDYALSAAGRGPYFLGSYEPMLIKHPPSHYLKMMYLEIHLLSSAGRRAAPSTPSGVDHFCLRHRFAPRSSCLKREGRRSARQDRPCRPRTRNKVYYQNAKKLLKL